KAKRVAQALLHEPDQVVVLIGSPGDLAGLLILVLEYSHCHLAGPPRGGGLQLGIARCARSLRGSVTRCARRESPGSGPTCPFSSGPGCCAAWRSHTAGCGCVPAASAPADRRVCGLWRPGVRARAWWPRTDV